MGYHLPHSFVYKLKLVLDIDVICWYRVNYKTTTNILRFVALYTSDM